MKPTNNLLPHLAAQEQKTKLDSLYELKRLANKRGCIAYVIEGRLIVVSDGQHHTVEDMEGLDKACEAGKA